jgi:hypothetical protein
VPPPQRLVPHYKGRRRRAGRHREGEDHRDPRQHQPGVQRDDVDVGPRPAARLRRSPRHSLPPYLARYLDGAGELLPLVGLGEEVAVDGGGEAALVAEAELVEGDIAGRLVDPALERVLRFDLGAFGAHDAEHHGLARGHEAERGEVARAAVVVLEEEAVDPELVEQDLGDRLVAALGDPGALVVAAAEVDADCHVGGPALDRLVDQAAVEAR